VFSCCQDCRHAERRRDLRRERAPVSVIGVVLIVLGGAAFVALLVGSSAMYDARAARAAGNNFGAAAGVHIAPLRRSSLLADRLTAVRWGRATRVGINHGRFVLDDSGLHWRPSALTGRKVPAFEVSWSEVQGHSVKPGPKFIGRRVAHLTLTLSDGTPLRFATFDPDGLTSVLHRFRPSA
jgi:hypothetical protein